MPKKEYVEQYVAVLDNALLGLFDESKENEILAKDKAALGDDYEAFEKQITAAFDKVSEARDALKKYAETL
ncbi:hypothetical protein J6X09_02275 [Candidatus Saccharibacteria bacterium]|nr:hypothetical protein [Candidatus Saccharibacteria bacterium]